jgi:hypothetical protein
MAPLFESLKKAISYQLSAININLKPALAFDFSYSFINHLVVLTRRDS